MRIGLGVDHDIAQEALGDIVGEGEAEAGIRSKSWQGSAL